MTFEGKEVDWAEEFNGAVTVCDKEGIIVYMNQYSIRQFNKYGGEKLLGKNILDCHPEPSKSKLRNMLENPIENMYTTESSDGTRKMIFQTPWNSNGEFCGVIEISFQLAKELPDFIR